MTDYKTCKHSYDTGGICNSAAATGRDYCGPHLRCRARQLRIAQVRARNQRFDLKLPPIESMSTVLSALNQIVEAVAADMIDLKRADFLLKTLRFAAQALKNSDKWLPSVFHTDVAAPAINLESEYGLPDTLDLDTSPENAFPQSVIGDVGAPSLSPGDRVGAFPGGAQFPSFDRPPLIPEIPAPIVRDYTAEAEAAFEATPEDMELTEIYNTQGYKAWDRRAREHQRDSDRKKQRKLFRANYARYAAEAKLKNIQRAAEKLIAQKLAAEKAASQSPQPLPQAADDPAASAATRKQPTSIDKDSSETAQQQQQQKETMSIA